MTKGRLGELGQPRAPVEGLSERKAPPPSRPSPCIFISEVLKHYVWGSRKACGAQGYHTMDIEPIPEGACVEPSVPATPAPYTNPRAQVL